MSTKALTINSFNSSINEEYLDPRISRDEAAQWVMNHYLQHPLNIHYYYDPFTDRIFHVVLCPSTGLRRVYLVNPGNIRGYKVILLYEGKHRVCKYYSKFLRECKEGRILL